MSYESEPGRHEPGATDYIPSIVELGDEARRIAEQSPRAIKPAGYVNERELNHMTGVILDLAYFGMPEDVQRANLNIDFLSKRLQAHKKDKAIYQLPEHVELAVDLATMYPGYVDRVFNAVTELDPERHRNMRSYLLGSLVPTRNTEIIEQALHEATTRGKADPIRLMELDAYTHKDPFQLALSMVHAKAAEVDGDGPVGVLEFLLSCRPQFLTPRIINSAEEQAAHIAWEDVPSRLQATYLKNLHMLSQVTGDLKYTHASIFYSDEVAPSQEKFELLSRLADTYAAAPDRMLDERHAVDIDPDVFAELLAVAYTRQSKYEYTASVLESVPSPRCFAAYNRVVELGGTELRPDIEARLEEFVQVKKGATVSNYSFSLAGSLVRGGDLASAYEVGEQCGRAARIRLLRMMAEAIASPNKSTR